MKKEYKEVEMEVICFDQDDVIETSPVQGGGEGGF